jgi:hypothetical protein
MHERACRLISIETIQFHRYSRRRLPRCHGWRVITNAPRTPPMHFDRLAAFCGRATDLNTFTPSSETTPPRSSHSPNQRRISSVVRARIGASLASPRERSANGWEIGVLAGAKIKTRCNNFRNILSTIYYLMSAICGCLNEILFQK